MRIFIYSALLFCLTSSYAVVAQTDNAERPGSCNVACNCNIGQNDPPSAPRSTLIQGSPGKMGAKGDVGAAGGKGEKGETGAQGQKGSDADEILLSRLLGAMSATSCQELKGLYSLNTSGSYLMMDPSTRKPIYKYCDFKRYEDARTCQELFEIYNITTRGSYLLGKSAETFQQCDGPAFSGIYTCQQLRDRYPSVQDSGFYKFKTQGSEPFSVYCNFSQTLVATEIHHDLMNESAIETTCESDGCFTATPTYELAASSITKIIDNSQSCRQFIKLRCQGVLFSWKAQFNRGWWVARNGEHVRYWGGTTRNGYCACGEKGTCIDNTHKCNCDNNAENIITSDEGYLTDKTKLPLKQIKIGDMGGQNEVAWYTIGKLECFG